MSHTFYHTGDMGDVLASLPIIRHMGGGKLYLGPHIGDGHPREPMTRARAEFMIPLLTRQPYLSGVEFGRPPHGSHDFSYFRLSHRYVVGELLTFWQAKHFGIPLGEIDLAPWLEAPRAGIYSARAIFSRSSRYQNPRFNWRSIASRNREALFVGLPQEHQAFVRLIGAPVGYLPVKDMLDMASAIAGCRLFVGNQSCPCWLAMAMGVPLIQESWPSGPNSRIERPNARFVMAGI